MADCHSDIFLVCEGSSGSKYFQIWVNNKEQGFDLVQQETLPSGTQTISFADIGAIINLSLTRHRTHAALPDRDGTLDMMFASCSTVTPSSGIGSTCSINIAYNKQLPLCASATTPSIIDGRRVCRPPDNLCTADPNFQFDLTESANNDVSDPSSPYLPHPHSRAPRRHSSASRSQTSSRPRRARRSRPGCSCSTRRRAPRCPCRSSSGT